MSTAKERRGIIRTWWQEELANDLRGEARGLSARLRRASTFLEVLSERAVHELGQKLKLGFQPAGLALLAATLARVEETSAETLARRFGEITGQTGEGNSKRETRILSETRMQNIIRADDPGELAVQLRRALPLAGDKCNVGQLGDDLLLWTHPSLGEQVRARWWFDYYRGAMPAAQDSINNEETPESEEAAP